MIGSTRQVAVYAYTQPTDMRKSFDGLAALVTQGLQRDPLGGDLFLFVSRNRKRAKVLLFDGTGVCIYAKRLEVRDCRFTAVWTLAVESARVRRHRARRAGRLGQRRGRRAGVARAAPVSRRGRSVKPARRSSQKRFRHLVTCCVGISRRAAM